MSRNQDFKWLLEGEQILCRGYTLFIKFRSLVSTRSIRQFDDGFSHCPWLRNMNRSAPSDAADECYINSVVSAFQVGKKPVVLGPDQLFSQRELSDTVDFSSRLPILMDRSHYSAK